MAAGHDNSIFNYICAHACGLKYWAKDLMEGQDAFFL